jgi:hypothetical protein
MLNSPRAGIAPNFVISVSRSYEVKRIDTDFEERGEGGVVSSGPQKPCELRVVAQRDTTQPRERPNGPPRQPSALAGEWRGRFWTA